MGTAARARPRRGEADKVHGLEKLLAFGRGLPRVAQVFAAPRLGPTPARVAHVLLDVAQGELDVVRR